LEVLPESKGFGCFPFNPKVSEALPEPTGSGAGGSPRFKGFEGSLLNLNVSEALLENTGLGDSPPM
jgi:hypothetical protein